MRPTPDAPPAPDERRPDIVESLQRSDMKRWSPRGAGLPALFDWWPSYVALAALTLIAVLVATRTLIESLLPFGHVLIVFSFAAALTFAIAPLVGRLEERVPRPVAVTAVFVALLAALAVFSIAVAAPISDEGKALADRIKEYYSAAQGNGPLVVDGQPLPPAI